MIAPKQDLKAIIKPLIKECVKEVILESGVLSKIITEVVQGLQGSLMVESKAPRQKVAQTEQEKPKRVKDPEEELVERQAREDLVRERQERASKMMQATGMTKIFANLQTPVVEEVPTQVIREVVETKQPDPEPDVPLSKDEREELMEQKKKRKESEQADAKFGAKGGMALKGIDPTDPGINIKGILSIIGGKSTWANQLKK